MLTFTYSSSLIYKNVHIQLYLHIFAYLCMSPPIPLKHMVLSKLMPFITAGLRKILRIIQPTIQPIIPPSPPPYTTTTTSDSRVCAEVEKYVGDVSITTPEIGRKGGKGKEILGIHKYVCILKGPVQLGPRS